MGVPMRFTPGQNFDCSLCGKCCGDWRILVDSESEAKIRGSHLELRVIQDTGRPALKRRKGEVQTALNAQGRCVFLNAQKLCSVQAELGAHSKPTGCHKFPFQYTRTPDGVFVGVSFYCDAAQRNEGRPLNAHADAVFALLDEETPLGSEARPVFGKVTMPWEAYRLLEKFLSEDVVPRLEIALGAMSTLVAAAGSRRVVITSESLTASLQGTYRIEPNSPALRYRFGTLVGHLEAATDKDLPDFTQKLLWNRSMTFRRYNNWSGPLSDIEQAGALAPWAEAELERYLKALLFRKFLVAERPIQHNLAILYLLPRIFRVCAGLSRLGRGADVMEPADVYRAFEECEYTYITHAMDLDKTFADLGRGFLKTFA